MADVSSVLQPAACGIELISPISTRTVNVLTKHSLPPLRADSAPAQASTSQLVAPLVSLQGMLTDVSSMLDNVLNYVKSVNSGSQQGDSRIGRYLLETLASVPTATSSKGQFEEDFNSHLAVCFFLQNRHRQDIRR